MEPICIIGGGLAGCEAAWQAANLGVPATLYEMRPARTTPAHTTDWLAELVCSNSLKSASPTSAPGILKKELRLWDSVVMSAAETARVPAGQALAVDRERFAQAVTEAVESHPLITVHREEVDALPAEGPAIVATGPLTSEAMSEALAELMGSEFLYFYDAISPIVDGESIDYEVAYFASRYGKGGAEDYLNCPLTDAEYDAFYDALVSGETYAPHAFEEALFFEGCLPIEEMARRGRDTPRYGPMKPVGLVHDGRTPHAVVQLRREDAPGSAYNLVGFQTKLKWAEQARIFRLIPGLGEAEFLRYGMVHRNTYINAPAVLGPGLAFRRRPDLFCAGQLTGVEEPSCAAKTPPGAPTTSSASRRSSSGPSRPASSALSPVSARLSSSATGWSTAIHTSTRRRSSAQGSPSAVGPTCFAPASSQGWRATWRARPRGSSQGSMRSISIMGCPRWSFRPRRPSGRFWAT